MNDFRELPRAAVGADPRGGCAERHHAEERKRSLRSATEPTSADAVTAPAVRALFL